MTEEIQNYRRASDRPMNQAVRYALAISVSLISFLAGQWYHRVEKHMDMTDLVVGKVSNLESINTVQTESMKEVIKQLEELNLKMAVMIDHDKRHFGEK